MIHNAHVQDIETSQISSDEFWSFVQKNKNTVRQMKWHKGIVGLTWLKHPERGLILATRVGKQSNEFIAELIANTEGKTSCKNWYTDDWGGYEPVVPPEVEHIIGKDQTQQERTN